MPACTHTAETGRTGKQGGQSQLCSFRLTEYGLKFTESKDPLLQLVQKALLLVPVPLQGSVK